MRRIGRAVHVVSSVAKGIGIVTEVGKEAVGIVARARNSEAFNIQVRDIT